MFLILLTILVIADTILTYKIYSDYIRYRKALEEIASAEYDMNKLVSIAIKAIKNG